MNSLRSLPSKPSAYWDRTDKVVRDWSTGQALPDYEGQCMVYSDMRGPLLMQTYLNQGQRQWKEPAKNSFAGPMGHS